MLLSLSVSLCRYTRLQWLPAGCRSVFVAVFYYLFSAFHTHNADSTIKSLGALLTELSVSMIGWLFVIDGAWPTGQPPKSIQTAGKDEMAARKLSHTYTHTNTH